VKEGRPTLLVVDDVPSNRDLLSRRLLRAGFDVLTAQDGKDALARVETGLVDLVLLDIMMPGMSGLEVLTRLRERYSVTDLPVIMVTAKSESEDLVDALGRGANDYVTKPVDFPVVLARVQAQLRTLAAARAGAGATPPRGLHAVRLPPEPESAAHVVPGVVLGGRYRIESKVGGGNFGTVYRALHLDLDRPVAVKVLAPSLGTDAEALARFRAEGISACRVRHPNAVTVVDFGVSDRGVAYLAMELLEGWTFEEELLRGRVTVRRAAQVLVPICGALAEAHRSGVVHRDVKPANIFLHREAAGEVPKILDFGIAKLASDAALSRHLTLDGSLVGTPAYMAPERFRNRAYGPPSDVYSLGVTLYQALSGRLPFLAETSDALALVALHTDEPPPPLGPELQLPRAVVRLVELALAKEPEERPTAEDVARVLAASASGGQG
jgi:CheY-like chemotaxis protein